MTDPAIGALLAGAFVLLFASAAIHKARDLGRFAEILSAYRVLPPGMRPLSALVPGLELLIAAALLVPASRTLAAVAGAVLLGLYAGAIGLNLRRGRRDLACGCGGPNERRPIAAWMVGRNLLLAGLLGLAALPWVARPLQAADLVTIGAGLAVSALLYMSVDRLGSRVAPRAARLRGAG